MLHYMDVSDLLTLAHLAGLKFAFASVPLGIELVDTPPPSVRDAGFRPLPSIKSLAVFLFLHLLLRKLRGMAEVCLGRVVWADQILIAPRCWRVA